MMQTSEVIAVITSRHAIIIELHDYGNIEYIGSRDIKIPLTWPNIIVKYS